MRSLIPFILGFIGIVALTATIWILFSSGEEEAVDGEAAAYQDALNASEEKISIRSDLEYPDEQISPDETIREATTGLEKEQLLPAYRGGATKGTLAVRVVLLEDETPVTEKGLKLDLFLNDTPIDRTPVQDHEAGSYLYDRLLPGRYRVDVTAPDWKRGSAGCLLWAEGRQNLVVRIAEPDHLILRVVDEDTLNPIPNARLEARGFIQGGLTDQDGYFDSARKYTPDSNLTIQISHPSYFSTMFNPLFPKNSGAAKRKADQPFLVKMTPLSGDLVLSGMIIDEKGTPVSRLALFLSPDDPQKKENSVITTYSDREGTFRFDRLTPGRYILSATLRFLVSRYITSPPKLFEIPFTLHPQQNLENQIVKYTLPEIPFRGQVYQADNTAPVPDAEVSYLASARDASSRFRTPGGEDPLFFEPMTTDDSGFFQSEKLFTPEEIYRMIVYGNVHIITEDGIDTICRPQKTPEGLRQMQVDILLNRSIILWIVEQGNLTLNGRIVDDKGLPLSGVRVTADSALDITQGRMRGYSDEDGSFTVSYLFPGKWVLSLMIPRGPILQRTVIIPDDGKVPDQLIQLDRGGTLEGQLHFDQMPGRWQIRVEGIDYKTENQKIGQDLWYSFQYLPPGKAQVILETYEGKRYQESYLDVWEAWVDLLPGKSTRRDFTF